MGDVLGMEYCWLVCVWSLGVVGYRIRIPSLVGSNNSKLHILCVCYGGYVEKFKKTRRFCIIQVGRKGIGTVLVNPYASRARGVAKPQFIRLSTIVISIPECRRYTTPIA